MITSGDLHLCRFIPVQIYTCADLQILEKRRRKEVKKKGALTTTSKKLPKLRNQ